MGKPSASARLFLILTSVPLFGAAGVGGYMWQVNRAAIQHTDGRPTAIPIRELGAAPKPAYLSLADAVPGEPVLVRTPRPPRKPGDEQKYLPPTMTVWVPLYPKGVDPKTTEPAAWHQQIKVPDADKYTPSPGPWVGLHADFAFGVFQTGVPAEVRAKFPNTTAPVLLARHEQLWVICQIPGVLAAVFGVLGLACLVALPWASWDRPKVVPWRKKGALPRLTRPVRWLPRGSVPEAVYDQGGCIFRGGVWVVLLVGAGMLILGGWLMAAKWTDGLGNDALPLTAITALGGAAVVAGIWQVWKRADRVEVHADGLRWQRDRQYHECRWDDVVEVYRTEIRVTHEGVFTTREANVRVVLCDGTALLFDYSVPRYEELTGVVLGATFDHLLRVKRQELAGGRADFGPFDLTADGVEHDTGGSQRWADLTGYRMENGELWFCGDGLNLLARGIPCKNIPNLLVLLDLLDERFERSATVRTDRPWLAAH